ncbi:MAG: DUF4340 domain-containing protein [Saprospiraceae bacterium]|nr:DUF4340 domain-containing protein [Bacteroidia bacterium]NNL92436.1 DUF4340 domain-containing protein [Saprospiraceae bacterium]
MNKTVLLILSLILLSVAYYFLAFKSGESSINLESRDFIVDDINDIHYVTLKSSAYPMMHLKKEGKDNWILNEKYDADINVVNNLIGVLNKMQIKYTPTKAMNSTALNSLEKVGIQIKAYDKSGQILSDFIMGSNDNAETATFCVRRGYKQTYAMHVAVTEGGLRNYFDQTLFNLRDKSVFKINPNKVKSLTLEYPKDRKNSYIIESSENGYNIAPLESFNIVDGQMSQNIIEAYIKDYSQIYAEVIKTGEVKMDSIKELVPFAKLSFQLNDETRSSFDFYPMLDLLDNTVNTQSINDLEAIERYFVFSDADEAYVVQHRMVKNFFKPITYFYKK